jgi:hypothetical protein
MGLATLVIATGFLTVAYALAARFVLHGRVAPRLCTKP